MMQNDFIRADSPEGIKYLSTIDKLLAEASEERKESIQAFKSLFNKQGGCDPYDFLDFMPHGTIGTQGPQNKYDIS